MTIVEILKNLLSRDADCRCGNMKLTHDEEDAITIAIRMIENEESKSA